MKVIYCVRHGRTDANNGDVRQGPLSELNEIGRRQSDIVARHPPFKTAKALIASSDVRAVQTAEAIGKVTHLSIEKSDLFVERRRPSSFSGKCVDDPEVVAIEEEIKARFGEQDWRHSDEETYAMLRARAQGALRFLESRTEEQLIVVQHGMFLRYIVAEIILEEHATPRLYEHFLHGFDMQNTGITVLRYDPSKRVGKWKVWTWNDHAHLG